MNEMMIFLTTKHIIIYKKSTVYHPQCHGQMESTNKILMKIIKKIVETNKKDCWVFRISYKVTMGIKPFRMAFDLEAMVQMEYLVPSLRLVVQVKLVVEEPYEEKIHHLLTLEEERKHNTLLIEKN